MGKLPLLQLWENKLLILWLEFNLNFNLFKDINLLENLMVQLEIIMRIK